MERLYSDGSWNPLPWPAVTRHALPRGSKSYQLRLHADRDAGEPQCDARDGNPVNLATGGKFQRETDLAAAADHGLALRRSYNGPATATAHSAFGSNWRHSFNARITRMDEHVDGFDTPGLTTSTYFESPQAACSAGWTEIAPQFSGAWVQDSEAVALAGPSGEVDTCSIQADGVERLRGRIAVIPGTPPAAPAAVSVVLHRPDGRARSFHRSGEEWISADADAPGRLTEQTAADGSHSGWTYTEGNARIEHYNADGTLQSIDYASGHRHTLEHDAEGRLVEVRDGRGRRLAFSYNSEDRISSVTGPDGRVYHYAYDSLGNLTEVRYPDSTTRQYHYESADWPHGLTGITDENGHRYATWAYDDQGRAILSEHAGGAERHTFEYTDTSTTVTNPLGKRTVFHRERIGGRMQITDIDGEATALCPAASRSREYDDQGHLSRRTDWNGNATTYEHNDHGLETSRTEAAGTPQARTITTEWDPDLRLPLTINEPGLRTQYTYDTRGRRLTRTETDLATGETRATAWSYHPDSPEGIPGQLAAIDGPRTDVNDVTTYQYDNQGNRTRVTNALGHVTEITDHDAYGRPLRLVDPNGLVTELTYDPRGRLLSRHVGGETTTFAYDAVGNLTRITLPDGSELHYEYDPAQRLIALADDEGHRIDYTLDAAGNRIEQNVRAGSGTLVRTQQQVFDELNRLLQTIGAQGQTTEHAYDNNGNRVTSTDPAGDFVQNAFDALDRLTQVTDPLGGITTYDYDQNDRITAVTDPNGNTTHYTWNAFGDRIQVDSPDSGLTTYEHDAAGNAIAKTDAKGHTTQYTHDALNRLLQADYADGAIVDYVWDEGENGIGRLAQIEETASSGETHRTEWQYDGHGRVTERTQTVDDLTLTTQHSYDSAGRRTQTIYPSGRIVTYSHDRDELTGLEVDGETVLTGADYQPFGPIKGWTWGDGDVHQRHYDLDGRLEQHSLASGSPAGGSRILDYTADHNIASISGPQLARTYGYDGLDRLVVANDPDRTDSYAYDANGNRIERIEAGAIETYTTETDSNRLLQTSSDTATTDYSYDENGNLIADGSHSYTYSARNRLTQVDDGNTAQYRYNALGQRIHKQAGSDVDYAQLAAEAQQQADEYTLIAQQHRDRADYWWDLAAQDPMYEAAAESYDQAADYAEAQAEQYQQQADEYTALANGSAGSGESQYFVYNESGQLIGRYDSSGAAIREYFWLGSMPVAVAANDELYHIHGDQLGTPRAVSEPGGNVIWSWISDPFGDSEPNEDPDGDGETFTLNLRHSGQFSDAETGLYYNYFRIYDPGIGRYITSDPIGLPGGLNTYGYAEQDPLNMIDPLGLSAGEAGAGMGAAMRESGEAAEAALECRDIWCSRGRYPGPFDTIETCLEINPSVAPMCADYCRALTRDDPDFSKDCVNNQSCGPEGSDARRS